MNPLIRNLFDDLPETIPEEWFQELLTGGSFRLERIVSRGCCSTSPGEWCLQERSEWVVLLAGRAGLRLEGHEEILELTPGDFLRIPAGRRHRVEWTAEGQDTVWLALHYSE